MRASSRQPELGTRGTQPRTVLRGGVDGDAEDGGGGEEFEGCGYTDWRVC